MIVTVSVRLAVIFLDAYSVLFLAILQNIHIFAYYGERICANGRVVSWSC